MVTLVDHFILVTYVQCTLCCRHLYTLFITGFLVPLMPVSQNHIVLSLIFLICQQWTIPCVLPCLS